MAVVYPVNPIPHLRRTNCEFMPFADPFQGAVVLSFGSHHAAQPFTPRKAGARQIPTGERLPQRCAPR